MKVYLDNNATTQIDPEVVETMNECFLSVCGNPASQHRLGQAAKQKLEDAREKIAEILNINITASNGDRLVFTCGGTESNNLAIFGLIGSTGERILISSLEHPSVLQAGNRLLQLGQNVRFINGLPSGQICLEHLKSLVVQQERIQLVAVMAGNHETGVLQPISQVAQIVATNDAALHVDAVQWIGKLPFDFQRFPASTVSFAAHKFHGPPGIGALAIRRGVRLKPHSHGGSQQFGIRPGTETVALAVGMAKALQLWNLAANHRLESMKKLRNSFESKILAVLPTAIVNGQGERLPHTSNISFPSIDRQALFMALDFAGIACSTGSACESGSSEPSSVLTAMQLNDARISSSIRFSLSALTTQSEIEFSVCRIVNVLKNLGFPKSDGFSAA